MKSKREAQIIPSMFRLVTGQLPTSREVVERHMHTFLERAQRVLKVRHLLFHVGEHALVYDMDGQYVDQVEIPPHTMLVSAQAFEQQTGVLLSHRADAEMHAHHFLRQAQLKGVPTLRFELTDGQHVNLSVHRMQRLEEHRLSNPDRWRRFVEYDEQGGGEPCMWAISLESLKKSNGQPAQQAYHDYCMARGTVVGDRLLLPDRQFRELQQQYPEHMTRARRSFAAHDQPAPEQVVNERLALCEQCEKWLDAKGRCSLACCGNPFRIADADYQCLHPDGPRWLPYELAAFTMTQELRDALDKLVEDPASRELLLSMAPILADQLQSFVHNPSCGTCRFTLAKALADNPDLVASLV